MSRLLERILLAFTCIALIAATPGEVVPGLEANGFYIEDGSSASPGTVGDAVAEANFAGGRLFVVVLSDEPPSGATFFSDGVLDELGTGTVLTVAPETVGFASDGATWDVGQLETAVDFALDGSSDTDVVVRFVEELTGADVSGGAGGGSSGGSGGSVLWFLLIAGGFVAFFMFLRSRSNKTVATARAGRLDEFRAVAQEKLNEVANDILDMEEEVRLAENPEIQTHYSSASVKYAEVVDAIDEVTDPDKLLELTYQLDLAIWELDVAEAMLDGKPAPRKPERPRVETPKPEAASKGPVITSPTRPPFDRRPQRQSSPAGPDLGSILMAILAARSLGGGSGDHGGWTGAPRPGDGGGFGGGGRRGGSGRIRGGGRRRG